MWLYEHANTVEMLGQMDAALLILEEKPAPRSGSAEANCCLYNLMHLARAPRALVYSPVKHVYRYYHIP